MSSTEQFCPIDQRRGGCEVVNGALGRMLWRVDVLNSHIRPVCTGWNELAWRVFVMQCGEDIMADKTTFTPDEWKILLESVMAPGLAITSAEPSGLWGLLKESFASGTLLAKAKTDTGANPLVKAVVNDFATSEGASIARDSLKQKLTGKKPEEIKAACLEILGQLDSVLSSKAPGDAAPFKNWLREISEHVAEASKEGGFLGFGGVAVSETEKATLAEISSALKIAG